ncbi:MAG: polysaccharide biosynthesis/export family protein [Marinoscillum sp.]
MRSMIRTKYALRLIILCSVCLYNCKAYKQDILFRLDENFGEEDLTEPIQRAQDNYELQVNDMLTIEVFTNNGERIIDPNRELQMGNINQQRGNQELQYLINVDSTVKVPMIGNMKLTSLTIQEAEAVLEQAFDEFYNGCFVKLRVVNRRVTVLGVNGGQVITLENENMTLAEIIALYGGLGMGAKANNIKLIRGDLSNPMVYQIDLTTIDAMKYSIMEVESGDIIYVEPWRRPVFSSFKDAAAIMGFTSSIITFIFVIQNL